MSVSPLDYAAQRNKPTEPPAAGTFPIPDFGDPPTAMAASGEASSKLLRFLYFVGAGVICTKVINTYREYEHKKEASAAVAAAESALAAAAVAEPAPAAATAVAAAKP